MNDDALIRLRKNLDLATDDNLVALANRGLVRRATKDLQQGLENSVFTIEVNENAVLVRGDGWTVTMPEEGPAKATDDTQASGVTRQILTATMFLRDSWQPTAESEPSAESSDGANEETAPTSDFTETIELLVGASSSELAKWCGKTPLLEATSLFPSVGVATVMTESQLKVSFADADVSVLLMTDQPESTLKKLLDQFKSTAPKAEHARWVMMAVLGLKQQAGKSVELDPVASSLPAAVKEDRQRLANKVLKLTRAVAATGVAHPSTRVVERCRTASVAAEAARFPRMARLLGAIADDIALQIARHSTADLGRTIQRLVTVHALAEATVQDRNADRTDLFGQFRSAYAAVGELQLCGLGAYGWRTASGFEGITALFWDEVGKRFLTASNSRGEGQDYSFTIQSAYKQPLGWTHGKTIAEMCRSRLTLNNAKLNSVGRISTSDNCQVAMGDPTEFDQIDFGDSVVEEWSQLTEVVQASEPLGLRQSDPRSNIVILKPTEWSDRWFDELHQSFVWQLLDRTGATLQLRVHWSGLNESAILFLESMKVGREKPLAIVGRTVIDETGLSVHPFSILSAGALHGDTVLCPQFDEDRIRSRNAALLERLRRKFKRNQPVRTKIGDEEGELDGGDWGALPPQMEAIVHGVDHILTAALEAGARSLSPQTAKTLATYQRQLDDLGLAPLAASLQRTIDREDRSVAGEILRAAFRLRLCRQASRMHFAA